MDFKALMNTAEYDFLRDNPHLGNRIVLLGISGSYGYGTNREGSDVDFRGVALNSPSDLIGLTSFEQYDDRGTDTVIYAFNKLIKLLLNCNPNTIELLGLDDDQYLIKTGIGQELLDNRALFLSKRAAVSFGRFAESQIRRLDSAVGKGAGPQSQREKHALNSVRHALEDFNGKHGGMQGQSVRLYIDAARTEGLETEIVVDADFRHYPLREYNNLMNSLNSVVREYDKAELRGKGKDADHLSKHAMHLVRLFMMGIDILDHAEIRTHRSADDLALLRSIRNMGYMEDGVLTPEFYEIVADYEARFAEAEKRSTLPDEPDMEAISRFVESVNRRVVMGDVP